MQRSHSSNVDKAVLSGTEKSVGLKHEESEDPTLIQKPHDEAKEVRKANVLASCVPSQPSSLGQIHEFVYVGNGAPQ